MKKTMLIILAILSLLIVFASCNKEPPEECQHLNTRTSGTNATCEENGTRVVMCKDCGQTIESETIYATGHDIVNHEGKAPSCTEMGWDAYETCTKCGYSTYIELPMVEHDEQHHEGKAPTCTDRGWDAYVTCNVCDYSTYKVIEALGHSEIFQEAKAPTCSEIGWYDHVTCSRCDYTNIAEIPMIDHVREGYTCTVCGDVAKTSEGLVFESNGDGTCYITGIGDCTDEDLVIPMESPRGEKVTGIGSNAFSKVYFINSVIIPETIEFIGSDAFYSDARFIEIEGGVRYVGRWAVDCKKDVTEVVLRKNTVGIANYVFEGCNNIKEITIPETVKRISRGAFRSCINLEKVILHVDVEKIDGYAFHGCLSLSQIVLPSSLTYIGEDAFANCSSLEEIIIPDSVTKLGWRAFANCYGLKSVMLGVGVDTIHSVFYNCTNLEAVHIKEIAHWCAIDFDENYLLYYAKNLYLSDERIENLVIPAEVTEIGKKAFYGATSIKSVTIHDGVTLIGEGAFEGCTGITSVTVPASAIKHIPAKNVKTVVLTSGESIDNRSFDGFSALESVTIPSTVKSIGDYAFIGCSSLTEIEIPDSVTSIGAYAFAHCLKLESISVPASVASIGERAFVGCTGLLKVIVPASVTTMGEHVFTECSNIKEAYVSTLAFSWIPRGNIEILSFTGGESISLYAMQNSKSLKTLIIGASITEIGLYAFSGCANLESITVDPENTVYYGVGNCIIEKNSKTLVVGCQNSKIPADGSVTSIGESVFADQSNLKEITIPNGIESIGLFAFHNCTGLTSITIPDSVTVIGNCAFAGCSNVTSLVISKNATTVGDSAFANIDKLKTASLPASAIYDIIRKPLTSVIINGGGRLGAEAFMDCRDLVSVTILEGVTDIIYSAFEGCTSLKSVDIKADIQGVGYRAFYKCSALESLVLPDSITDIGDEAFAECLNLKSINIPAVKTIWSKAFYGCKSLENIVIPEGVETINTDAFNGCSGITELVLPESVKTIFDYAFAGCTELKSITIKGDLSIIADSAFMNCPNITSATVHAMAIRSLPKEKLVTLVIEGGIHIDYEAFMGCTTLESVVIGDSVTTLGSRAFKGCTSLKNVKIGEGITFIGTETFSGCSLLGEISIPSSVNTIDKDAFLDCTSLEYKEYDEAYYLGNEENPYSILMWAKNDLISCRVHDDAVAINWYAFKDCTNIMSVTIGKSVKNIGSYAFEGCIRLVEVCNLSELDIVVGSGASYNEQGAIGRYAKRLYTDENLGTNLEIEDGYVFFFDEAAKTYYLVNYIGSDTELILLESIHGSSYDINGYAFYGFENITKVTILGGVVNIPQGAFFKCTNLESFTANEVAQIGDNAFGYCEKLKSFNIYGGPVSIGDYAFYSCKSIESVTLPSTLSVIGLHTFSHLDTFKTLNYMGTEDQWNSFSGRYYIPRTVAVNFDYVP